MKYKVLSNKFIVLKGRLTATLNNKFKLIQRLASNIIPPVPPLELVFSHYELIDQFKVTSTSTTPVTVTGINGFSLSIVNTPTAGLTKITIDQAILDLVKTYMPEAILQDLDIQIQKYSEYAFDYTLNNPISYYLDYSKTGISYQLNECDIQGCYYHYAVGIAYSNAQSTKISIYIPVYKYI